MSALTRSLALGACFFVSACDPAPVPDDPGPGIDTGTPHLPGKGEAKSVTTPHCKRVEELLPNADTPVGSIIPRQLALKATTSTRGKWIERKEPQDQFLQQSITPSADNIQGQVNVAYTNGAVRLVKNVFVDCTPGAACADIGVTCIDQIEVDLQVTMNSDNGVFAETWTGTLSIPDPRDPDHNFVEPEDPNPEPVPDIPKEYSITTKLNANTFSGTATLQTGPVQPGFKLVKNELSYSVHFVDNKLTNAAIGAFVMVEQPSSSPGGSGIVGAGSQNFYTFQPEI